MDKGLRSAREFDFDFQDEVNVKMRWNFLSFKDKVSNFKSFLTSGMYEEAEALSSLLDDEELDKLQDAIPKHLIDRYIKYVDAHTDHALDKRLNINYITSITYISHIGGINALASSIEMLTANNNNKKISQCVSKIKKQLQNYEDISYILTRDSLLYVICRGMNSIQHLYDGYGVFVEKMLEDSTEHLCERFTELSNTLSSNIEGNSTNTEKIISHSIILYITAGLMCENILNKYYELGENYERKLQDYKMPRINVSSLKSISESAKQIVLIATNYSMTQDVWQKVRDITTEHILYNNNSMAELTASNLNEETTRYRAFYFATIALSRRSGKEITPNFKDEITMMYGSAGGYSQVMKDIAKLNRKSDDLNNCYDVASRLLELMNNGESFPAFNKIISHKITSNHVNILQHKEQ